MRLQSIKPILGVAAGILLSLTLYILWDNSPYIFGVGLVVGVYLSSAESYKRGGIYGGIIALFISTYLVLSNSIRGLTVTSIVQGLLIVIFFTGFGTLYGIFIVLLQKQIKKRNSIY